MSSDAAADGTLPPGANGASTDHAPAANGGALAEGLQGQGDPSERRRRSAAVAVEQFVQTAPLGEFERRLELLASFRRGTCALAVYMPRRPWVSCITKDERRHGFLDGYLAKLSRLESRPKPS